MGGAGHLLRVVPPLESFLVGTEAGDFPLSLAEEHQSPNRYGTIITCTYRDSQSCVITRYPDGLDVDVRARYACAP